MLHNSHWMTGGNWGMCSSSFRKWPQRGGGGGLTQKTSTLDWQPFAWFPSCFCLNTEPVHESTQFWNSMIQFLNHFSSSAGQHERIPAPKPQMRSYFHVTVTINSTLLRSFVVSRGQTKNNCLFYLGKVWGRGQVSFEGAKVILPFLTRCYLSRQCVGKSGKKCFHFTVMQISSLLACFDTIFKPGLSHCEGTRIPPSVEDLDWNFCPLGIRSSGSIM